ncbi:sulfite exporter TauE/SafE family protein [Proteinivorax hydrogeniformans]|uniref:Probable membrane transporter protein n=1 Tax=Proteinivorax hydrogeniformans TaxID=1826727 RepID=A0AAU8HVJ7_9FIRM
MDSSVLQIVIGLLIIFLAAATQGIASFGFSIISLPLLGVFLPLQVVVPMLIIYSLVLNSMILQNLKEHIDFKRIWILVVAGVIGTPFGVYLLKVVDENTLKIAIGVILTISAVLNFYGIKVKVKREKLTQIPVGLISGLFNGSASIGGPPIIIFLTNQGVKKQIFRANLTLYFWLINIVTIPTYVVGGLITTEVIQYTLFLLPGLLLGTMVGINLGNKVDENLFAKLTLVMVMGMGLFLIKF